MGIALLTPEMVHYGHVNTVLDQRADVLTAAYRAHPDRFIHHPPVPQQPSSVAYINRPTDVDPASQI